MSRISERLARLQALAKEDSKLLIVRTADWAQKMIGIAPAGAVDAPPEYDERAGLYRAWITPTSQATILGGSPIAVEKAVAELRKLAADEAKAADAVDAAGRPGQTP
jgi:hypothetical protein